MECVAFGLTVVSGVILSSDALCMSPSMSRVDAVSTNVETNEEVRGSWSTLAC